MREKSDKTGKGAPPAPSPGGNKHFMSAETSITEDGYGRPRQGVSVWSGAGRQKTTEEEVKVGILNDSSSAWPRSTGGNPQGSAKAKGREQKKKGGAGPINLGRNKAGGSTGECTPN